MSTRFVSESTLFLEDEVDEEEKTSASIEIKPEDDPVEKAKKLKAQAQRARLEAERMDAELTLDKINRLEKEMQEQQKLRKKR